MKALKIIGIVFGVILAIVLSVFALSEFLVEVFWWESLGYLSVYFKMMVLKVIAFLLPFLLTFAILNIWIYWFRGTLGSKVLRIIIWISSGVAGVWGVFNWKLFIWNIQGSATGYSDPFFGLDAYFYMFRLPLLRIFILLLFFIFLLLFILDLFVRRKNEPKVIQDGKIVIDRFGRWLLFAMLIISLFVIFGAILEELVTQPNDKIGVGYAVVAGDFVGYYIFMGVLFIVSSILILRLKKGVGFGKLIWNVILVVASYFLLTMAFPALLKKFWVDPNELMMQEPFISHRIEATRQGFGLFFDDYRLLTADEEFFEETVRKARIWDAVPYRNVIKQMQEIRLYFDFIDVDVGKYMISNDYYQTVQSARELNVNNLSADAMTWDNLHLRYTHGYGMTLSPANQVNSDGGPQYWIRNLENQAEYAELEIEYPQIYFGELTSNYVIVDTKAEEFEYTTETNRVTTRYQFDNGISIRGFLRRFIFSVALGEQMILYTRYITKDSKVLFRRQIHERVREIFPFLEYDDDPYITFIDGKLYWILDAYTTSDRYPISQRYDTSMGNINYLRNSVKVVIDAYRGEVTYYVVDDTDPILRSYQYIFPELFISEIPEKFEDHFRYPVKLFNIQSEVMQAYHVDDTASFYNGDDVWKIPDQILGSEKQPFEPYYILSRVSNDYQFSLIQPFTPTGKENLQSWMIAYYDQGPHITIKYVERTRSSLGPMQVESLINQDEDISQLFSLWGQKGSEVYRGNIQFIPLSNDVLYLESVFLESEDTGIPQLALIIAVYESEVYSGENISELLYQLIKAKGDGGLLSDEELLRARITDAYLYYLDAERDRVSGDINSFRENVDNIGEELKKALTIID